jgi:hypothetical protein
VTPSRGSEPVTDHVLDVVERMVKFDDRRRLVGVEERAE